MNDGKVIWRGRECYIKIVARQHFNWALLLLNDSGDEQLWERSITDIAKGHLWWKKDVLEEDIIDEMIEDAILFDDHIHALVDRLPPEAHAEDDK